MSTNINKIIGDFRFITFTKEFRYSNYVISYDLDDYANILTSEYKKANQAMVGLKFFWDSDHVDISTNLFFF